MPKRCVNHTVHQEDEEQTALNSFSNSSSSSTSQDEGMGMMRRNCFLLFLHSMITG